MSTYKVNAVRVVCDGPACTVSVVQQSDGTSTSALPDGWYEIGLSERRTFHSDECLVDFIRDLTVIRWNGGQEVASVGFYLEKSR